MCTATWLHNDKGYDLFFNRDERHTRAPGRPPVIRERNDVQYIAPTDGNHGGTWIAVNQFGLSLCLLNAYEKEQQAKGRDFISRGSVVMDLIDSASLSDLKNQLIKKDLSFFQSFRLLGIMTRLPAFLVEWDGMTKRFCDEADSQMPLSSSSFDTENVVTGRRNHYAESIANGKEVDMDFLMSFHKSHVPTRGAYSVCMHREDARTVSFSHIRVTNNDIQISYYPDSPCSTALSPAFRRLVSHRFLPGKRVNEQPPEGGTQNSKLKAAH